MLTETTGGSTSQYLWGPGGLVRRNGEWPTTDALGNTRTITNGSQSVTSNQVPDAYGCPVSSGGTTAVPYQWHGGSGYRQDLDAGLVQVGARYYDPAVGRFTSRDSDLSQSAYVYCNGDPVNCSDPSGHSVLSSIFKTIGKVVNSIIKTVVNYAVTELRNIVTNVTFASIFVAVVGLFPAADFGVLAYRLAIDTFAGAVSGYVTGELQGGKSAFGLAVFGALDGAYNGLYSVGKDGSRASHLYPLTPIFLPGI